MAPITRREAIAVASAAVALCLAPAEAAVAEEATAEALASAQAQYESVQAQIDTLAWEYEQLSYELDYTLSCIEQKWSEISYTQGQIESTQAELANCQAQLETYVSNSYKHGSASVLDILLASADFEELFRNMYYLTKVNDAQAELIEHTREVKAYLEEEESVLEGQLGELESLRDTQQYQLWEMQDRQSSLYYLLWDLDGEVRALTEQYNEELFAQAQAAAEAEAAAAAAAESGTAGSWGESYGGASLDAVLSACNYTGSPGAGYCAAWVSNVFANAGVGFFGGDACDMYASWCYSSDRGSLAPGMIVAVSTHSGTAAGPIYGHVGIYVGGGTVMDNIGYIRSIDIDSWCSFYGTTVTPRWGWLGGVSLG